MTDILFFNRNTREMRFVDPIQRPVIEKLQEQGWLKNPNLIHMHNPHTKQDAPVLPDEQKLWEMKGFYANPTMIYHPEEGTKQVSAEDANRAFKNGWYPSPAFFPGNDIGKIKTPGVRKDAA